MHLLKKKQKNTTEFKDCGVIQLHCYVCIQMPIHIPVSIYLCIHVPALEKLHLHRHEHEYNLHVISSFLNLILIF